MVDDVTTSSDEPAEQARVLVAVEEGRDRDLLIEWIASVGHDPVTTDPAPGPVRESLDGNVDLLVTDARTVRRVGDEFAEYRERRRPEYVPCLLIGSESDAGGAVHDIVDETVTLPTRKEHLGRRVEALLRARQFSVELDERKAQYSRLLGLAPDAIVLVTDGEIVYGNETARGLLGGSGIETASIQGRRLVDFVVPEDRPTVDELLTTIQAGETPHDLYEVTLTGDGREPVPVEVAGVQVPHEGGIAAQLVIRDVGRREERERRLKLFGRAMEEATVGVSIADLAQEDNPLVYVNQAFETLTGYGAEEVLRENCRFLQGEGTNPDTVAEIREGIDAREEVQVRIRNYRKDGTPFWNEVELVPFENDADETTHYLGFHRDVTEREERKRALQEYETYFEAAGEPIYSLDAEGRFTNVNDALCELTGYEAEELLGEHTSMVMDEADVERCERTIAGLLSNGGNSDQQEVVIRTADRGARHCVVTLAILPFEETFRGTVGVVQEVTQTRQRQQQLAVMDRVLRHDIRNTMNVILGRADLVDPSDDVDRRHVEEIVDAAESLLGLSEEARDLHDLLIDRGGAVGPVDLVPGVQTVVQESRERFPAATVTVEAPDRARVVAHEGIPLAVQELVENAIVHSDRETPQIAVSVRTEGDEVVVVVEDDGPGLPEGEATTLEGDVESALEHASGLGLWLVRWIVGASGGTVASEAGDPRGTRMVVRLNAVDESE